MGDWLHHMFNTPTDQLRGWEFALVVACVLGFFTTGVALDRVIRRVWRRRRTRRLERKILEKGGTIWT